MTEKTPVKEEKQEAKPAEAPKETPKPAETSKQDKPAEKKEEREYVIPLRNAWINTPKYKRSGKAIKAIKQFVARHMKVPDRDTSKVKLDVYFNNDIWFKGPKKPPAKVKVKVVKEGDLIKVNYAESPDHVNFLRARHLKIHKKGEKKAPAVPVQPAKEEKTPEEQKEEKEKAQSAAESSAKEAKQQAKAEKHVKSSVKPQAQPKKVLSRH